MGIIFARHGDIESVQRLVALISLCCLTGSFISCNSSSTTDGKVNQGGSVTVSKNADQQSGGTEGDWSQGTGAPGTAPSNKPEAQQVKSSSGARQGQAGQVGSSTVKSTNEKQ